MDHSLTADDVLAMAEQLERQGAEFYRLAYEAMTAPSTRRKLAELADWEERHEKAFADMRASLAIAPGGDEDRAIGEQYVRTWVDSHVFDRNSRQLLARCKGSQEIIELALELEKDSIVFYVGLKDYLGETVARAQLEAILREEMRHVAMLGKELAVVKT